jgi:hypothetical protein
MVSVFKEHTVRVGSIESTINVLGMKRNIHHISKGDWIKKQIEALPTVMKQAREGNILIYTYIELEIETMKGTFGGELRGWIGDLLKNVKIEYIPSAVERSKFQQMDLREYAKKETFIRFCKLLLEIDYKEFEKRRLWFLSKFTDFERQNIKSLNRFNELCSGLSEKHYPDAFHLWTAEVNSLDYFLRSDHKFINVMTKTGRAQLNTKPIAPVDLLNFLGITEREPMPVSDYDFHTFF